MKRKENLEKAKNLAQTTQKDKDFFEKEYNKILEIASGNPELAYMIGTDVVKDVTYARARFVEYIVKSSPLIKKQYKKWKRGKIKAEEFDVSPQGIEKLKYNQVSGIIDTTWVCTVLSGLGVFISGIVLKFLGAQDPLTLPIIGSGVSAAVAGGLIALPDVKTERVDGKKKERSRIATIVAKKYAKKYEDAQIDNEPLRLFKEKVDDLISPYLDKAKRDREGVTIKDLENEVIKTSDELDKLEAGIDKLSTELEKLPQEDASYNEKTEIKESLMKLHHDLYEKFNKLNGQIFFEKVCEEKGYTKEANFKMCEKLERLKVGYEEDLADIESAYKRAPINEEANENE